MGSDRRCHIDGGDARVRVFVAAVALPWCGKKLALSQLDYLQGCPRCCVSGAYARRHLKVVVLGGSGIETELKRSPHHGNLAPGSRGVT